MTDDEISKIICESLNLRAYTVNSLNTVRTITSIHETTPNATVAMGRVINATALLSASLKPNSDQNISIRLSGTGPIKEIIAQADARGNLRGYAANPDLDALGTIDEISFSKTIGAGFITVTKDLGLKEPYKSIIPINSGELANDMAYYLTVSEQIPSALIIGLQINRDAVIESSGGILIQSFPNTDEGAIALVEDNIKSMKKPLGEALKQGQSILSVLSGLFGNETMNVIDAYSIQASCRCGKDLLKGLLKSIPRDDLELMLHEDRGAEVTCSFCRKKYLFSEDDLREILSKKPSR